MKRLLRQIRRAPARIVTSVFALALAVGAIGVLAIPTVATSSLRDAAARDRMGDVLVTTSESGVVDLAEVARSVDGVEAAEAQIETRIRLGDGSLSWALGTDVAGADGSGPSVDRLHVAAGRLPVGFGEIVVPEGGPPVGSRIDAFAATGEPLVVEVVGHGTTSSWSGTDVVYTNLETATALGDVDGVNRLALRAADDSAGSLDALTEELRAELAIHGVTFVDFPITVPAGEHPIEADIEQVSTMIGLLGVVAGIVALVLLASTTTTLITERSREVAIMRAIGAPNRPLRRQLRRLALGIAAAAVVIGVPLGVVISNVIARLVLQEFVGLTPDLAVSVPVMVGSALFAIVGARLVSARAARRVTRLPLAEALRDRDGAPFGRRWSDRVLARIPTGRLLDRTALRSGWHHRARSTAIVAQIGAAIAALLIVTSMATTVNDFNRAQWAHANWASRTFVAGPGLDIDASAADADPRSETAIEVLGRTAGWDVDVVGLERHTAMIDRVTSDGRWLSAPGEAVVSTGFAGQTGIDIGDRIEVTVASGPLDVEVVGLHPDRGRSVILERDELAGELGAAGMANHVLSLDETSAVPLDGLLSTDLLDDLVAEGDSGADAIVLIFGAIGLVVVSVAGLAVASGLAVNVYERRHEFAALQAIGGRRRHVFRAVTAELLPLTVLGVGVGVVAGYVGSLGVVASFESSSAIEIGLVFATAAVPVAAAVVVVGALGLAGLALRRATRHPVAVTLRGTA